MAKKISKEDQDMIAAERIGAFLCRFPVVDGLMSGLIKDKAAKNVLTGSIALKAMDALKGKKGK